MSMAKLKALRVEQERRDDEVAGDVWPNCAPGDPCKDCLQDCDDKYAEEKIKDQKEGR